jgi:2,3-bisphosphoglycerate-independent phosphoglycerate mutase
MPTKMLCILDGLGLAPAAPSNAVYLAKMPTFRKILSSYPWITLNADGEFVGQEDGLVGNSEVGHTNIGGLKLVKQLSLQVTESAETNFTKLSDDQLFAPDKFLQTRFSAGYPKVVHLFGLFSTASVHSDLRHWLGAVRAALLAGAECVVLHLISDGRDSDRQSLLSTWREFTIRLNLDEHTAQKIVLGSLGGRFYLMDRDRNFGRNWQGLQVCLDQQILVDNQPILEPYLHQDLQAQVKIDTPKPLADRVLLIEAESVLQNLVANSYAQENFDETIVPVRISGDFGVKPGDTLWLVNFRADRMRQLVTMLADLNERLETNCAI